MLPHPPEAQLPPPAYELTELLNLQRAAIRVWQAVFTFITRD